MPIHFFKIISRQGAENAEKSKGIGDGKKMVKNADLGWPLLRERNTLKTRNKA